MIDTSKLILFNLTQISCPNIIKFRNLLTNPINFNDNKFKHSFTHPIHIKGSPRSGVHTHIT